MSKHTAPSTGSSFKKAKKAGIATAAGFALASAGVIGLNGVAQAEDLTDTTQSVNAPEASVVSTDAQTEPLLSASTADKKPAAEVKKTSTETTSKSVAAEPPVENTTVPVQPAATVAALSAPADVAPSPDYQPSMASVWRTISGTSTNLSELNGEGYISPLQLKGSEYDNSEVHLSVTIPVGADGSWSYQTSADNKYSTNLSLSPVWKDLTKSGSVKITQISGVVVLADGQTVVPKWVGVFGGVNAGELITKLPVDPVTHQWTYEIGDDDPTGFNLFALNESGETIPDASSFPPSVQNITYTPDEKPDDNNGGSDNGGSNTDDGDNTDTDQGSNTDNNSGDNKGENDQKNTDAADNEKPAVGTDANNNGSAKPVSSVSSDTTEQSSSTGKLAQTGASSAAIAAGMLLVGLGAGAVVVARRRQNAE